MTLAVLDTHAFIKRLTAAGMPEAQAEILADHSAQLLNERLATKDDLTNLATKDDLTNFATKTDIAHLQTEIAESKAELLKWLVGLIGFQTLAILGAALALSHALR